MTIETQVDYGKICYIVNKCTRQMLLGKVDSIVFGGRNKITYNLKVVQSNQIVPVAQRDLNRDFTNRNYVVFSDKAQSLALIHNMVSGAVHAV